MKQCGKVVARVHLVAGWCCIRNVAADVEEMGVDGENGASCFLMRLERREESSVLRALCSYLPLILVFLRRGKERALDSGGDSCQAGGL